MTEYLFGILLLFFIGSTNDRGQANFHVQQKVGGEVTVFDGKIAFATLDGSISYYLLINEQVRAEDGTLKSKPAIEFIGKTGNVANEPGILLDRLKRTYRTWDPGSWASVDFPAGIISGFGINKDDNNAFLAQEVADERHGSFNRLSNGGFLLRVRDTSRGNLLQSITVQAAKPGKREWFKQPYIVNVVFDISDEMPDDSLFNVPDGFEETKESELSNAADSR